MNICKIVVFSSKKILQVADLGFAMVCSFDRQDMFSENSKETGSLP